jgi:thiamine biosynthesis lipoprotein
MGVYALLVLIVLGPGCDRDSKPVSVITLGGLTMGTTYTIKINEASLELTTERINSDISDILNDVNMLMSTHLSDSELSRINQSTSNDWIPLSPGLYQVINNALRISEISRGSFDVTVGPLVNLWGFGPTESRRIPDSEEISTALAKTGFQNLLVRSEPPALKKMIPNIYIDLSGIAKGYAVDEIAEYLDQQNINNYMVEIGGEIRAKGVNEVNFAWRIGIEKPEAEQREVQRVIKLDNIGMATSGDYRNFFEEDGKRYSHTIDPRTGLPVAHTLASVTVLHKSAAWADALATAFLVMGKEAAYEIAVRENIAVLFIQREQPGYAESYTNAFLNYLLDK